MRCHHLSIELCTSAWALEVWGAKTVDRPDGDPEVQRLKKKLPHLREAMRKAAYGSGSHQKGRFPDLPPEVIRGEFELVRASVKTLLSETRSHPTQRWKAFRNAMVSYSKWRRPMFICEAESDEGYTEHGSSIEMLALFVTSKTFDLHPSTIRDAVYPRARDLRRQRRTKTLAITDLQKFLVATLYIGWRSGRPEGVLLEILSALRVSKFDAIGLYNIALHLSTGTTVCKTTAWGAICGQAETLVKHFLKPESAPTDQLTDQFLKRLSSAKL